MNSTVARLIAASLLLATVPAISQTAPVEIDDFREFHEHVIEPYPVVTTPWVDLTRDYDTLSWTFHATIDEQGMVRTAQLESGDAKFRDEAQRVALSVRFKPFVRNGQPVVAWTDLHVWSRATDYLGPTDRTFPAAPDLSQVVISLKRTQCLGTCPEYRVQLRGDGEVLYRGEEFVLVKGTHRWHVDPATIAPLLEIFRRAEYFKLDGYYQYPVTDLPTYVSRLSIGNQHKFVLDYGGSGTGNTVAFTGMPGKVPAMPSIVTEIENAIDRISGAIGFVFGDETTLQRLRDAKYDFRSKDAGSGLRMLLSNCKTGLATEYIRAGAPVNIRGEGRFEGSLPIEMATYCVDFDLVRLLIDKGALKQPSDAKEFLWASVGSGQPRLVEIALTHYRDVNSKNEDGRPLLMSAADGTADDDDPGKATFDPVKVLDMLIDAGADPNARDAEGKTPIFEANTAATVTAIIRRGADPKARDSSGKTALFDEYFDETKPALIAAGIDVNARDKTGRTALFYQGSPVAISTLLNAGADINAVDSKGSSVIEQMNSEEGALALLAAGAKLPADPARLAAMVTRASERNWTGLLARLETAAAGH